MGAGISAGAFADGFYKGYSLVEKSMRDNEELQLKKDAQTKKLQEEAIALQTKLTDNTVKVNDKIDLNNIKRQEALDEGKIDLANTYTDNNVKTLEEHNRNNMQMASITNKQADLTDTSIEANKKYAPFVFGDKTFIVPKADEKELLKLEPSRFTVTNDGKLALAQIGEDTKPKLDSDGKPLPDTTLPVYSAIGSKKQTLEEKGYDEWKKENPNGKTDKYLNLISGAKSTTTKQYKVDGKIENLTAYDLENYIMSGKNPVAYTEAKPQEQYTVNGKVQLLTAERLAELQQNKNNKIVKYEKPTEVSNQLVVGADGTQYVFNPKTTATKVIGKQVTKEEITTAQTKKEALTNIGEINTYLSLVDKVAKENPKAITSLGEKPVSFVINKLNDIVGVPSQDREDRAKVQQFQDYMKISLASAVQKGALTQKDVDAFSSFMPNADDDTSTRKSKMKGAKEWIARNTKALTSGSTITKQSVNQPQQPTVTKTWSDSQYIYQQLSNGKTQRKPK